jgi:hypothetical protein
MSLPYSCVVLENDVCKEIRDEIVIAAIRCTANFSKFKSVRDIFNSSNIFFLLISIMFKQKDSISKQIPEAIGVMLKNGKKRFTIIGCQKDPTKFQPYLFFYLLKFVTLKASPKLWMDFRFMATNLCINETIELSPYTVNIDQSLASEYMMVFESFYQKVFSQTGEVYNPSWTFESCRASHGITLSGKFAFEFLVGSGAIMQIGWATSDCCFDPYLGQGVGGCFSF